MKLAIIGSRTFDDWNRMDDTIWQWFRSSEASEQVIFTEVISGGAKGADSLAAQWAREQGVKLTEFKPDWDKHGKRAGFIRNEDIVAAADMVLCFWDGVSRGTGNSLSIAKRLRKPTLIIYV